MASRIKEEDLKLNIIINGNSSRKELIELKAATNQLNTETAEMYKHLKKIKTTTDEGKQAFDKLSKEINANEAAIKSNNARIKELQDSMGLAGLTINELKKKAAGLRQQLANMIPGDPNRKLLTKELADVDAQISKVSLTSKNTGFSLGKMADGFNKYFGLIGAFAASFTGIVMGFRKLVDTANQFGESLANLSSLTGLVGSDLQWLGDQAKILTKSGTDSGIKITASAQQIVDAYTKMGSAKPELLANKEALDSVTQQALILAEAAKMEAAPAVESLANTMNQFNAPAEQAGRYVNVIAAGSKAGAAEVEDIGNSIVKFGAAAASANISVEQSVAMIEALSEKGIKGEIAGTALKTMLVKLQVGADEFNPKIVGLNQALENLGNANLSTAEMAKIFGTESIVQAQIIIENRNRVKELETAITGTNVAFEQATVNTETNAAALKRAQNAFQLTAIDLGEKLAPALTFSTNAFSYFIKVIMWSIKAFKEYGPYIMGIAASIAFYTIATNAATIATKAKYYWTLMAEKAEKLFQATSKMNPWVAIASLIIGVVVALAAYSKKMSEISASQKMLNDLNATAQKNTVEEKIKLEQLMAIAKDRHKSLKDKRDAIEAINKISPEYLGSITLENIGTKEATKATENYIKALEKKALMQAAQEKLVELEKERIDAMASGSDSELSFLENIWQATKSMGNSTLMTVNMSTAAGKKYSQAQMDYNEKKKALLGIIGSEDSATKALSKTIESADEKKTIAAENAKKRDDEAKKKAEQLKRELDELLKAFKLAQFEMQNAQEDSDIAQVNSINRKYDEQVTAANGNKEKIKIINRTRDIEISEFWRKINEADVKKSNDFAEEKKKKLIETQKALEDKVKEIIGLSTEQKLQMTQKEYDEYIAFAKEKGYDVAKIEEDLQKKLQEIKDSAKQDSRDPIFGKTEAEWKDIEKKFNGIVDKIKELGKVWEAYNDYRNAQSDAELQKEQTNNDKKKEALKKQLDNKLISQKSYDDQIKKMDDEMEARKKQAAIEQAKRQKQMAIFNIILSTAQAVMAAMSIGPWGIALAAVAAIAGALQLATVMAAPLPQAYEGTYEQVVGAQDGRTYNAKRGSGSGYFSTPTIHNGNKLVAERGPELVFSAPDTRRILNTPGMIEAINYSTGRIPQYASGNYDQIAAGRSSQSLERTIARLTATLDRGVQAKLVADPDYVDTHNTVVNKTQNIRRQSSG